MINTFKIRSFTPRFSITQWIVVILSGTTALICALTITGVVALQRADKFFYENEFVTKALSVNVQYPEARFVKRELKSPVVVVKPIDDGLLQSTKDTSDLSKQIDESKDPKIAMYIAGVFGENASDMIAIFTAESGLNTNAMGWNCTYGSVSRACDEADRVRAWSVDCGVAQLNFSGKECPKEAFDPIWNINAAKAKFESQGKEAWVAYWTSKYLAHK